VQKAVKYSIENLINEFGIENRFGLEIYLDASIEQDLLVFIRENLKKFMYILKRMLIFKGGYVYTDGPECTMEMRFRKCGIVNNAKNLNSRIYVIHDGPKRVLCYLDTNKKARKVKRTVVKAIKKKCGVAYEYIDSLKILINTDSNERSN